MNDIADMQLFILYMAEQANGFIFTLVHALSVRLYKLRVYEKGLNSLNKNYIY
jgi:hypothetical protein